MHLFLAKQHNAHRNDFTIQNGIEHFIVVVQVIMDGLIELFAKVIILLSVVLIHCSIVDAAEVLE